MADWASREDVEQAAADWAESVVQCRLRGHRWNPLTVSHDVHGYSVTERCGRRCGCERMYDIDHRGYASRATIHYPTEGYLLHGVGRIDADGRAALRLTWLAGLKMVKEVAA